MNTYFLVVRAIAGVTFQRIFRYLALTIGLIYFTIIALVALLMQASSHWWGMAYVVLIPIGIVLFGIGYIVWLLSKKLLPRSFSREERYSIHHLSSKILSLSQQVRTPLPVLAGMIAVDILRRRPTETIENFAIIGKDLRHDIQIVAKMVDANPKEL